MFEQEKSLVLFGSHRKQIPFYFSTKNIGSLSWSKRVDSKEQFISNNISKPGQYAGARHRPIWEVLEKTKGINKGEGEGTTTDCRLSFNYYLCTQYPRYKQGIDQHKQTLPRGFRIPRNFSLVLL